MLLLILALWAIDARAASFYVSHLVGRGGTGFEDGAFGKARFAHPSNLVLAADGSVFVSDDQNFTIRKIASDGNVSTLAGKSGESGFADGKGGAARFGLPQGLCFAADGALIVADAANHVIRRVDMEGNVSTIAGKPGSQASIDGDRSTARFDWPTSIAIRSDGTIYVGETVGQTIRKISTAGTVTTVAGLARKEAFQDGTGSSAYFHTPSAMTFGSDGFLYVADTFNYAIRRVDVGTGAVSTIAGSPGTFGAADGTGPAARFWNPFGIVASNDGYLYVCDTQNSTLRRVTLTGAVTTIVGKPGQQVNRDGSFDDAELNGPVGVALGKQGTLFVTEFGDSTIRRLDLDARTATLFAGITGAHVDGAPTTARLVKPNSIALSPSGDLFLFQANFTVRRISSDGTVVTIAGRPDAKGNVNGTAVNARLGSPGGVAIMPDGTLSIAEFSNNSLRRLTNDGTLSPLAGDGTTGYLDGPAVNAKFSGPEQIAVDSGGNVYVADRLNHVIRRLNTTGLVQTIAGQAGSPGFIDGIGGTARFNNPAAVAIGRDGAVYVADTYNHAIRRIDQDFNVTTIAGAPSRVAVSRDGPGNVVGFYYPWAIAAYGSSLLVADTYANTIRRVEYDGTTTTIAGQHRHYGSTDGAATSATFDLPAHIAVAPTGEIFVADYSTNSIRVISETPGSTIDCPRFVALGSSAEMMIHTSSDSPIEWSVVQRPVDSQSEFVNLGGIHASFTPDTAGYYRVRAVKQSGWRTTTSYAEFWVDRIRRRPTR